MHAGKKGQHHIHHILKKKFSVVQFTTDSSRMRLPWNRSKSILPHPPTHMNDLPWMPPMSRFMWPWMMLPSPKSDPRYTWKRISISSSSNSSPKTTTSESVSLNSSLREEKLSALMMEVISHSEFLGCVGCPSKQSDRSKWKKRKTRSPKYFKIEWCLGKRCFGAFEAPLSHHLSRKPQRSLQKMLDRLILMHPFPEPFRAHISVHVVPPMLSNRRHWHTKSAKRSKTAKN